MSTETPFFKTPLVVANWKMHGLTDQTRSMLTSVILEFSDSASNVVICPPYTALRPVGHALENTAIKLGAQDCHFEDVGAYTGEISAPMLKNIGCQFVIVGHSERRQSHSESNELINKKAEAAMRSRVIPIICIGESAKERDAGDTLQVIEKQLSECLPEATNVKNAIIAYEPLWAIGSGQTPSPEAIVEVHRFIAGFTQEKFGNPITALYGGSVKPSNSSQIMKLEHVNGVLVGGASLVADEFRSIVEIASLIAQK